MGTTHLMITNTILTGGLLMGALQGGLTPPAIDIDAKPACRGAYEVLTQAYYEDEGLPCTLQLGQPLALILFDSPDNDEVYHYCYDQGGKILDLDSPWICIFNPIPIPTPPKQDCTTDVVMIPAGDEPNCNLHKPQTLVLTLPSPSDYWMTYCDEARGQVLIVDQRTLCLGADYDG